MYSHKPMSKLFNKLLTRTKNTARHELKTFKLRYL